MFKVNDLASDCMPAGAVTCLNVCMLLAIALSTVMWQYFHIFGSKNTKKFTISRN